MTTRYPSFAGEILDLFAEREAVLTDIGIIQPADPFLDMAGEDLRRRIFLTESETGQSLCLRPEFTIPVCRDHIEKRAATPRRYAYLGEVFRQRREGGAEFFQAGIEDLGAEDRAGADARSLADAHALLARILPSAKLHLTVGDQSVFEAVLAALGLPRGWQMRLTRSFGSPSILDAAIAECASPPVAARLPREIASLVARGDAEGLTGHIQEAMEATGLSPSAGRLPAEIAQRLLEKAELRSVRLADTALDALKKFLDIRAPLAEAGERLSAFASEAGLFLDEALDSFNDRVARISENDVPLSAIQYNAHFGRPLDYYTGFIFEIGADGFEQPLVGGGRYDRLLTLLGAEQPIPGVGFSVWLDRVSALREGTV
ncbi:ATP phosphoribosyltransferase regulatory subunit [Chelativorans salis]|uniref:ATP phosphoribosyltransferase regulatory subunit n=1 Tax=Chelativorans salis TaxID=2978478 RepID=A0ABT2LHB8_9HYPH|nr:ATP phosphoribosyltransferase regulatory subunit [Chelativorans sp. EGI FJ00035]MCT7373875.1 ATP phosphoribosyltransferase regulatory subunit [Chelativorans sp. EGI FJ00035]